MLLMGVLLAALFVADSGSDDVARHVVEAADLVVMNGVYDFEANAYVYGGARLIPLDADRHERTTMWQGHTFVRWDIRWTASVLMFGDGPYCFGGTVQDREATIHWYVTC